MRSARPERPPAAGERAPAFRLSKMGGGETSLEEILPGGPVLLAFFKISCPVCQLTLPFLERIHAESIPGSLAIYGIPQDEPGATRDFMKRFGVSFPVLLDPGKGGYQASNAYRLTTVPTLFQLERDGTVSWTLEGFNKAEIQAVAGKAGVNPYCP